MERVGETGRVWQILRPRMYVGSIYDLDLAALARSGLRGLILDLDNTLVGWNRPDVSHELGQWVERARAHELKLCIVSNNLAERVERFAEKLGVMHIAQAGKPHRRAFRLAMGKMGTEIATTAVVGDQLFTDILGGNRLRLYTILVRPVDDREFWFTRLVRRMERLVMAGLRQDLLHG